ncbi:MAG: nucleotidyl transferase AbiEii/AbiGii toxin family protein [Venatoribacter sp.]
MANPFKYQEQVKLLLRILPFVAEENCFALKGGTAINLFVRDFPRLSVDIDLVYLPSHGRTEALTEIKQALERISTRIKSAIPQIKITKSYEDKNDALRLVVNYLSTTVQIELSPVLRGVVFPPEIRSVSDAVEDEFGYVEMRLVSTADIYAGKLCAAFDRQHPRDFFDVSLLLKNEGINQSLRQAFIVYLISHPRPMEEVLNPRWKDISATYQHEFVGMTRQEVSLTELESAAQAALSMLITSFSKSEKELLLSIYSDTPKWQYLPFEHIKDLPAIKWKLLNISKMSEEKRLESIQALKQVLFTPFK